MASCGLWLSRSTLWASVVEDDGKHLASYPISRTDDARWSFLSHLGAHYGLDCALVLTDAQARLDNIANLALQRKRTVWLASWRTAQALRAVAGLATGPPKRTARVLARMAQCPLFRAHLRKLQRDDRQLSML